MYHSKSKLCLFLVSLLCLFNNLTYGQIQQIQQELHKLSLAKDLITKVNSLNRLGSLYTNRNADSCFYYGMEAKRVATVLHYKKGETDADHMIAFALFKRGLYAESLELYGKVLSGYEQLSDTTNIICVYADMASVMNKDIDKSKVITFFQKAIQIGRKLKRDSIMAKVYVGYSIYNAKLSPDSVNYYLNRSREIASRYNDEAILSYFKLSQADLLVKAGRRQEAIPLIKQLIADVKRTGNMNLNTNLLFLLSRYYKNTPGRSLEYYYAAYELARKNDNKSLEVYLLTWILKLTEDSGNKDAIIAAHVALEKAMTDEKENTKKFIGDYVRYNAIENDNRLLSEKNARRTLWLLIVSFSAVIVVLAIYLVMLYRSKKAKAKIEALNDAVNMQIVAMEEAKHQAVREEQQRLGQDLHDGLSSSIAAIRHRLEGLAIVAEDIHLKTELGMLQAETARAYDVARKKSHEWFSAADEQQEQSFEKQIKLLTDNALPDSKYNKTIHIDDNSLTNAGTDIRIALLRIIQEAVTNIIKHAKAKSVSILIYEEEESIVLTIGDDGIGLGGHKPGNQKTSLGLESIRRRVQYLDGETNIHSGAKGTEVVVSIPLVMEKYV